MNDDQPEKLQRRIHMKPNNIRNKIHSQINKFFKLIKWNDTSIGRKYLLAFAISATFFIIAAIVVYSQVSVAKNDIEKIEDDSFRTHQLEQMASLIQLKDVYIADFIITRRTAYIDEYEQVLEEFQELATDLEPIMHTEKQKNLFNSIINYDDRMNDMFTTIIEDPDVTEDLQKQRRNQANRTRVTVVAAIDMLIDITFEEQEASVQSANQSIQNIVFILFIASGLAILAGILIVLLISRN